MSVRCLYWSQSLSFHSKFSKSRILLIYFSESQWVAWEAIIVVIVDNSSLCMVPIQNDFDGEAHTAKTLRQKNENLKSSGSLSFPFITSTLQYTL